MRLKDFESYIISKYGAEIHSDDLYYIDNSYFIYIKVEEESYNLYAQFTFPLKDYEEYEGESEAIEYELNHLSKKLSEKMPEAPCTDFESGLGCPFDDVNLGYFNIQFDDDIIDSFIKCCDYALESREKYAEDSDVYENQLRIEDISWHALEDVLIKRRYELIEKMYYYNNNDLIVSKKSEKMCITKMFEDMIMTDLEVKDRHNGFKYILLKDSRDFDIVIDKSIYNELRVVSSIIKEEDKIQLMYYNDMGIYFETPTFVGIIRTESQVDGAINYERNELLVASKSINEFSAFLKSTDFNFRNINYSEFESLISDLLQREGFIEIHPNGGCNASDGGIDIYANKIDNRGIMIRYLIQCKYSESENRSCGFNRKDAGEIIYLLKEKKASKFILFTNTSVPPKTIDRIQMMNSINGNIIDYYQKEEICMLLRENPDIASSYNLI